MDEYVNVVYDALKRMPGDKQLIQACGSYGIVLVTTSRNVQDMGNNSA